MPRTVLDQVLELEPFRLQHVEVVAEQLHVERTLEPRLGLLHRVVGRLRVVDDDARERPRASCRRRRSGPSSCGTAFDHSRVRLQPDVELGVVEARGIGAAVVATVLRRDVGDFGKRLRGSRGSCGTSLDDSSSEIVYGNVARTQSAPSSSVGMNSPPTVKRQRERDDEQGDAAPDHRGLVREAPVEHARVALLDPLERAVPALLDAAGAGTRRRAPG